MGRVMAAAANGPDVESGTCDNCSQPNRPLWRHVLEHTPHWDERERLFCQWCRLVDDGRHLPLLCVPCRDAETRREREQPFEGPSAVVLRLVAAQSGPEPVPHGMERRAS